MILPTSRLALLAATVAFAAAGSANADEASRPIRIVRAGHGDLQGLKDSIQRSVDTCRAVKKLPPAALKLPSDGELAKLAVIEEEELFDGQLWAKYRSQREYGGDPAEGCRLTLFVHRTATVERTCVSRVQGQNALLGEMMNLQEPSNAAPEIQEQPLGARSCGDKRRSLDRQGVASADAGSGQRCLWTADVLAKALGTKPKAGGEGFDTCLYDKQPDYYFEGHKRPVILMTRSGNRSMTGQDLSQLNGSTAAIGNLKLVAFSDGQAIPAARFTRAAVEAFIKQPAKAATATTP